MLFRWIDKTHAKHLLSKCPRRGKKTMCGGVHTQCVTRNRKTRKLERAINGAYVRKYIAPRATHTLVAITEKEEMLGFLVGSVKQLEDGPVFYIDLVCSAHRKGKDLLNRAEIMALSLGMRTITLRAASPKLLNVYRRRGYRREVDACKRKTRAQRRKLRDMDKIASALFQGNREEDWRTSGDGWWMSKCCAAKSNVHTLKKYIRSQPDKVQLSRALNKGLRRLFR